MLQRYLVWLCALFLFTSTVAAQNGQPAQSEPSPTPKPAAKRRTFDQFDLSNGPGRSSSPSMSDAKAIVEQVNKQTYDGITRMVKYAADIESEYRSSEGVIIDPSDHFEPYRILSRKLPSLYRITAIYQEGLLDETPLTDPVNVTLLTQTQEMIPEISMIANSTEAQFARNQAKLIPIAEKYGAPTYPVEKRQLLTAMFTRMNANFSRLMRQVAVRK